MESQYLGHEMEFVTKTNLWQKRICDTKNLWQKRICDKNEFVTKTKNEMKVEGNGMGKTQKFKFELQTKIVH